MKNKVAYLWEKYGAPRLVELSDSSDDSVKKPLIPFRSKFADAYDRYLKNRKRGKQNNGKNL